MTIDSTEEVSRWNPGELAAVRFRWTEAPYSGCDEIPPVAVLPSQTEAAGAQR